MQDWPIGIVCRPRAALHRIGESFERWRRLPALGRDGWSLCAEPDFRSPGYQMLEKETAASLSGKPHDGLKPTPGTVETESPFLLTFLLSQWIEPTADAGVNQYTFHVEPVSNVPEVCRKVREAGMRV